MHSQNPQDSRTRTPKSSALTPSAADRSPLPSRAANLHHSHFQERGKAFIIFQHLQFNRATRGQGIINVLVPCGWGCSCITAAEIHSFISPSSPPNRGDKCAGSWNSHGSAAAAGLPKPGVEQKCSPCSASPPTQARPQEQKTQHRIERDNGSTKISALPMEKNDIPKGWKGWVRFCLQTDLMCSCLSSSTASWP